MPSASVLSPPSLLRFITFPFDDETWRHLVAKYWQKETLLDGDLLEEHVINQPLLAALTLLLLLLSAFIFIASIIFVGCRSLGKCGAKRYQPHPTSGKRYSIYLSIFLICWCFIATASLYFIFSGLNFWSQKPSSERLSTSNLTLVRFTPNTYYDRKVQKRSANEPSISEMFSDLDYDGDFEKISIQTTRTARTTTSHRPIVTQPFKPQVEQSSAERTQVFHTSSIVLPTNKQRLRPIEIPLRSHAETVSTHTPPPDFPKSVSAKMTDGEEEEEEETTEEVKQTRSGLTTEQGVAFVSNKVRAIGRSIDKDLFRTSGLASGLSMSSYVPIKKKFARNEASALSDGSDEFTTQPIETTTSTSAAVFETTFPLTSTLPNTRSGRTRIDADKTVDYFADPEVSQEVNAEEELEMLRILHGKSEIANRRPILHHQTMPSFTTTTTETSTILPTTTSGFTETSSSSKKVETTTKLIESTSSDISAFPLVEQSEDEVTEMARIDETIPTASFTRTSFPVTTTRQQKQLQQTASTTILPSTALLDLQSTEDDDTDEFALSPIPILAPSPNVVNFTSVENGTDGSNELSLSADSNGVEWHVDTVPFEKMQTSTRVTLTFPNEHLTDFDMQTKIEQISPLPFPFRILHTSSVIWMARISFVLISTLIVLVVFPSIFLIIVGTVCYLHSYHPMDRSKLSDKIGSLLILLATIQLFSIPLLLCFSAFTLVYVHAYDVLCPALQMQFMHQMGALDSRITIDSAAFIDRQVINSENCRHSLANVEGMLYSSLLLALFSIPVVFSLFKVTKYFLRMKTEYYWSVGDNYGSARRPQNNNEEIYGPIYGEIRNKRRPPAPPPPPAYQDNHIYSESLYADGPIYGIYSSYGQI